MGISFGSANRNVLRAVAQKAVAPPSIIISLADKVKEKMRSYETKEPEVLKTYFKDTVDDEGTNDKENTEQPSKSSVLKTRRNNVSRSALGLFKTNFPLAIMRGTLMCACSIIKA